ncbi:MAG TPA: sulfur carrier protein ThiS [Candidatus Gallacutalibacter pullistercoris]|nr:sulfur carrier protein ThiS [Candidatus Gallacutalibacter pullistercoris]
MKWNGKQIALETPVTVLEFLQQQGYNAQRVAVERNGEIVRRADFEKELLRDEDAVEVVTFVGGG